MSSILDYVLFSLALIQNNFSVLYTLNLLFKLSLFSFKFAVTWKIVATWKIYKKHREFWDFDAHTIDLF